jgi:ABC-2 type transport system permease protein
MRSLLRLSWVELKLFVRDPMTALFSLALPVIILLVLGGVFGNEPSSAEDGMLVYAGVGPMTYYVPAYVALVVLSVSLISIPGHIAGNRERGVLKRYHASGVSVSTVAGAQVVVAFVLSTISSVLLLVVAELVYDFSWPDSVLGALGAFVVIAFGFAAFGIFLGSVLPTARSAQAVGLLAWFIMMMLGGAGPPREVLTSEMQAMSDFTPLWHAVRIMHEPWLGLDPGNAWWIFGGIALASLVLAWRFFRWE